MHWTWIHKKRLVLVSSFVWHGEALEYHLVKPCEFLHMFFILLFSANNLKTFLHTNCHLNSHTFSSSCFIDLFVHSFHPSSHISHEIFVYNKKYVPSSSQLEIFFFMMPHIKILLVLHKNLNVINNGQKWTFNPYILGCFHFGPYVS